MTLTGFHLCILPQGSEKGIDKRGHGAPFRKDDQGAEQGQRE